MQLSKQHEIILCALNDGVLHEDAIPVLKKYVKAIHIIPISKANTPHESRVSLDRTGLVSADETSAYGASYSWTLVDRIPERFAHAEAFALVRFPR